MLAMLACSAGLITSSLRDDILFNSENALISDIEDNE